MWCNSYEMNAIPLWICSLRQGSCCCTTQDEFVILQKPRQFFFFWRDVIVVFPLAYVPEIAADTSRIYSNDPRWHFQLIQTQTIRVNSLLLLPCDNENINKKNLKREHAIVQSVNEVLIFFCRTKNKTHFTELQSSKFDFMFSVSVGVLCVVYRRPA